MEILMWVGLITGHFVAGALVHRILEWLFFRNDTPSKPFFVFVTGLGYLALFFLLGIGAIALLARLAGIVLKSFVFLLKKIGGV